ncbi:MAG: hypothetical protein F6J93_22500 [Oscillatoria sp. SIO1A7]|nr:hypothetical protein [Oscillatoria sp. SIO1A7]
MRGDSAKSAIDPLFRGAIAPNNSIAFLIVVGGLVREARSHRPAIAPHEPFSL